MQIARMSIVEALEPTGNSRAAERRSLAEGSTIRVGNKPLTVEILNFSATGCLIRASEQLEPGMDVLIGLRGAGSFPAKVIRVNGNEAGCQFRKVLRPEQFDLAFTSNVHFIGKWNPSEELGEHDDYAPALSPLRRAAWIVGLSGLLWSAIGGIAYAAIG